MASAMDDPHSAAADRIKAIVPQVDPGTFSGPAFANAVAGTCLTWSLDAQDRVTAFTAVDCEQPHRFEVAGRIDLNEVPGFGSDTPLPDTSELAPVGTDRCMPMVNRYTGGRQIDPNGRFTGLVVPPSEEGWNKGDHAVLCGIASSELDGRSTTATKVFAQSDQHRRWDAGTCLGFTAEGLPGAPVPCSDDHSIEIISDVDVSGIYPEGEFPPEPRIQSELTAEVCHQAVVNYFGDPEALRASTLISTLVHPIGQISWATGSRTVNCGLMKSNDQGGFALLRGSAQQGVLVDGEPPIAPTTTAIPMPGATVDDGSNGVSPEGDAAPGTVPVPDQQGSP